MIKSISFAALAALATLAPASHAKAVDLEYGCWFNERVAEGYIYGGYRVGPDGEIRERSAGWNFDSGPAIEDMDLRANLTWRDGAFRLKDVSIGQNVVRLPSEETSVRISLPAGPAIQDSFISRQNIRDWSRGQYSGFGKSIWIGAPAFLTAMWESDRIEVVVAEKGGAEVLRRTYPLPVRQVREALAARIARLDAWVAKRDFSQCKSYDLDEEPDISAVI